VPAGLLLAAIILESRMVYVAEALSPSSSAEKRSVAIARSGLRSSAAALAGSACWLATEECACGIWALGRSPINRAIRRSAPLTVASLKRFLDP